MNCLLMLNRRCAQVQSEPSASRGSCWIFAEPEIICVDWCAYTQWIPSNHHVRHFDKSRPREWHPLCIFMSDSLDHFPSTAHTKDHRHGTCQHKYYINRYLQSLVARWIDICPHSRLASFQQARSICYKVISIMVTLQNHSQSKKKIGSSPKLHAENEVVYHQNSVKLVSTRRHLSHLALCNSIRR